MGRGRNRNKRAKGNQTLSGVAQSGDNTYLTTAKEGGLMLLAAIAAGGAGAAIGKHSLIAGIPVTLIGIHKKNPYIIAAGLGLTLSNGFQKSGQPSTTQGVDGFDIKQIAEGAKDRVGTFFQNFKDKLYLQEDIPSSSTAGLGENGEQVTYFVNPYSEGKELDMSAIDRIQEQVANMSGDTSGLSAIEETEREF